MKKRIIVLALAILTAGMAVAQEEGQTVNTPKYKWSIGLKGGINIASMKLTCDDYDGYDDDYDDFDDEQKAEWDNVDKSDDNAIKEFLIDNDFFDYGDFYETEKKHILSEDTGCFLTKRACQLHIAQNGYHYSEPHTYAMTAWRNPEFERLLHILKTTDFSKLIDKEE